NDAPPDLNPLSLHDALPILQNWMPYKKGPIKISVDEASGESAYWYKREDDYLLICGVGGKDKFGRFFVEKKIREAIIDSNFCSKDRKSTRLNSSHVSISYAV